jgi:hypothetical protein
VAAGDVVGPQAHRHATASVGTPIDGDPVTSHKAKGNDQDLDRMTARLMFDIDFSREFLANHSAA